MALKFPERIRPWQHAAYWVAAFYSLAGILLVSLNGAEIDADKLTRAIPTFLGLMLVFSIGLYLFPSKPFVRLEHGELFIRRPRGEWTFKVDQIAKIEIYGPSGGRCWRVHLKEGEAVVVPPIGNAWMEKQQTRFMQTDVSQHVCVEVQPPPSLFAQVRGDPDWDE